VRLLDASEDANEAVGPVMSVSAGTVTPARLLDASEDANEAVGRQ